MRQPLLDSRTGNRKSSKGFTPPPVGGLNLRDNPLSLRQDEARLLNNWIAYPDKLVTRQGTSLYAPTPSEAKAIMAYNTGTTAQLFAASDTEVRTISPGTSALAFSCTNADWQGFNFAAGGANYLYALNGVDGPRLYNGTTWQAVTAVSAPIAITGISPLDIISGTPYNERLFFLKSLQKSFYYLPVGQVGGALVEFPVGRYLARGGYLMAISTVSIDGGDGLDDYLIVASSEGEVLLYQGTDPSDSTRWRMRGSYFVGKPLNKHAFQPYGTETMYLCEAGLFSMPNALQQVSTGRALAVTDKVEPALSAFLNLYGPGNRWRVAYNPKIPCLLVNIPVSGGYQFVQQARGGRWSSFTGWPINDMIYAGGAFYFAGPAGVYRAFDGSQDLTVPITCRAMTAPRAYAGGGSLTEITGLRPRFLYASPFTYGVGVVEELQELVPDFIYGVASVNALIWNQGNWNQSVWAGGLQQELEWTTPQTYPSDHVAVAMQVATGSGQVQWLGVDAAFVAGFDW